MSSVIGRLGGSKRGPRPTYDWAAEFAEAKQQNETFRQFVRRLGCSPDAAALAAARRGHAFRPML